MKTFIIIIALLTGIHFSSTGQSRDTVEVTWLTLEKALEKSKTDKRPVFIDVYTDWCGWCKVMDKQTFSNPTVARLLNEKFYAVKLNAEQREDIVFMGTTYRFVSSGRSGYHELAAALLQGKLSYPTVVFLNENFQMIQPVPGFLKPKDFHPMAAFIGNGHYKNTPWADFQKQYKSPF